MHCSAVGHFSSAALIFPIVLNELVELPLSHGRAIDDLESIAGVDPKLTYLNRSKKRRKHYVTKCGLVPRYARTIFGWAGISPEPNRDLLGLGTCAMGLG